MLFFSRACYRWRVELGGVNVLDQTGMSTLLSDCGVDMTTLF
jgi:hypothetical protein